MEIRPPKILTAFSGNFEITASTVDGHLRTEKRPMKSVVEGAGGTSINIALQARELGTTTSSIITVGRDHFADLLREKVAVLSLPCSFIDCRLYSSFAFVKINSTGREVDGFKLGYREFPVQAVKEQVANFAPDCVVASGCIEEDEPFVMALFGQPAITVLNPRESLCEERDVMNRLLRHTDILYLNEGEFGAFVGKSEGIGPEDLYPVHELGPELVIVTKDQRGVAVSHRDGQRFELPAYFVGEEVDATGAGDVFLAVFLSCYLNNYPLVEAGQFATVVAGIKVAKPAGSRLVTLEEIKEHELEWNPWKYRAPLISQEAEAGGWKGNFEVQNGTYLVYGTLKEVSPRQLRRCPVCCTGPYARDGDMMLYEVEDGNRWWMCGYFENCGFCYPVWWGEDQPLLLQLVRKRQDFLRQAQALVLERAT